MCLSFNLGDDISKLKNLRVLRLLNRPQAAFRWCTTQKYRTLLPDGLTKLTSLEELSLCYEDMDGSLPKDLGLMTSLRILSLSTPYFYRPSSLIGTIPYSIQNLQQLEVLKFEATLLVGWHYKTNVPVFPRLIEFSVSNSVLFDALISPLIAAAPNLKLLDVSKSGCLLNLTELTSNQNLERLAIDEYLPPDILTRDFWSSLHQLSYFSANGARLLRGSIDASISSMTNLRYLDLSSTSLNGTIPQEIRSLASLEFLSLCDTVGLRTPLPDVFGDLKALKTLQIRRLQGEISPIPQSIGELRRLETLELSNAHLSGPIPEGLIYATNLRNIFLHFNSLNGTIPAFPQLLDVLDLHDNRLTGGIPYSVASRANNLRLSNNRLGPDLPDDIFVERPKTHVGGITLSHNNFSALLPNASNLAKTHLLLNGNKFYGTIPSSYCDMSVLRLDHNLLHGTLDNLLANGCGTHLLTLHVSDNQFTGTIPSLTNTSLSMLYAGSNGFESPLPELSGHIQVLDLGDNQFTSWGLREWTLQPNYDNIQYLDISRNPIKSRFSFSIFLHSNLEYLSLAETFLAPNSLEDKPLQSLVYLDLSYCDMSGSFPSLNWPKLSSLIIAGNRFTGSIILPASLTKLDISNNQFSFSADTFQDAPMLSALNASHNFVFGTLDMGNLRDLQFADLSHNHLDNTPDFVSIGDLFRRYSLRTLNIAENPLPTLSDLGTASTGLNRSASSVPSTDYPNILKCYGLEFWNTAGTSFIFDEGLFSYRQCDCDDSHFGLPLQCHACPTEGMSYCSKSRAEVEKNYFATWSLPSSAEGQVESQLVRPNDSPWSSEHSSSSKTLPELSTESCMRTAVHTFSGKSNCRGVELSPATFAKYNNSIESLLHSQCEEGSTGRMCSRCLCRQENETDCFYERGPYVPFSSDFDVYLIISIQACALHT